MCPFPELMLVLEGKLFFFIFAAPWYFFEKTVFKSHLNYSYKCFTRCSWLNTKQFRPIRLLWKPTGGYRCGLDGTVDLNTTMAAPRDVLLLCLELHQNWRVFFFSIKESKERHWWLGLDGKDGFVSSWYEFDSPTGSTDEALSHRWSDQMKLACDGWWWTDGSSNHLPNIFSGCLPFFQTVSGRASPDGSVQQTIWNGRLYFRLDHTTISFTGKIAPLPKWLIADYWVSFSHSSNS